MILAEAVICRHILVHFGKQRDKKNGKESYFTKEMDGMCAGDGVLRVMGQRTFLH